MTQSSRRDFLRSGALLGASLAGLPLLAACGDDAAATLDPSKAAKLDGVRLKLLVNQPNLGAWKIIAADFEAATGATFDISPFPYDNITSQAIRDVQSGAGELDLFQYWYAAPGDLTSFVDGTKDINPGDFLPSIYDTYTLFDCKRCGLPFDGDTFLLFYN